MEQREVLASYKTLQCKYETYIDDLQSQVSVLQAKIRVMADLINKNFDAG